jgi:hypothetical protein
MSSIVLSVILVLSAIFVVIAPSYLLDIRESSSDQLRVENDIRTTLISFLGGVAVFLGVAITAYNYFKMHELQRQGQVTERFSKAIDQLGKNALETKLGGIYALEQISKESHDLHRPVMDILSAFLREQSRTRKNKGPLGADLQAAAAVIGRRQILGKWSIDLSGAVLPKVDLSNAHLENAILRETVLEEADLVNCRLDGATLEKAILSKAHLEGAILDMADLDETNLERAYVENTSMKKVIRFNDKQLSSVVGRPILQ